jgi:hypothetical protein
LILQLEYKIVKHPLPYIPYNGGAGSGEREGQGNRGKRVGRRSMGKRGRGGEGRGKACIGPPPFKNPRYAAE